MKSVKLCGGKACCPELSLHDNKKTVTITDDFNNTVKMDVTQAKLITEALNKLLEEDKK